MPGGRVVVPRQEGGRILIALDHNLVRSAPFLHPGICLVMASGRDVFPVDHAQEGFKVCLFSLPEHARRGCALAGEVLVVGGDPLLVHDLPEVGCGGGR